MFFKEKWRKFASLSSSERRILLTAFLLLPASALALRWMGLKSCKSWMAHPRLRKLQIPPEDAVQRATSIARMVRIAVFNGIYKATCLPYSLTLWWLLRRQGIDSELYIAMQNDSAGLKGHAWVEFQGLVLNDIDDVRLRYPSLLQLNL